MENAKQKAIEVAYGEYWEEVKDFVDENGFIKFSDLDPNKLGLQEQYESTHHELPEPLWRLDGVDVIVTNNNWISIHSEDVHLIEDKFYFVVIDGNISIKQYHIIQYKYWNEYVSHYQPIILPSKPIF